MIRYILRGTGRLGWAYTVWGISALALGLSAWNGGWREALWALPIAAIPALLGYAIYWNPRLEIDDEQVRIVNIVREYFIPWEDLESIETRFGLYLHAHHLRRKVSVWAVPSRASFFNKDEVAKASRAGIASSERKSGIGKKDDAENRLQWNVEPGEYRRIMPLSRIAQQMRERRAEIYKQLTHNQKAGQPKPPSANLNELELKKAGREYAQAVGKISSTGLNVPNCIAFSIAALLAIYLAL